VFGKNKVLIILLFACFIFESKESIAANSDDDYHILACTRLMSKDKRLPSLECFEHCFLKFVKGNSVLDTRGFFQDAGSVQETNIFVGNCIMAKPKASIEDWGKITDAYDKHKPKDYKLLANNCCSVASEALEAVIGSKNIPKNISNANSSIGTRFKKEG